MVALAQEKRYLHLLLSFLKDMVVVECDAQINKSESIKQQLKMFCLTHSLGKPILHVIHYLFLALKS